MFRAASKKTKVKQYWLHSTFPILRKNAKSNVDGFKLFHSLFIEKSSKKYTSEQIIYTVHLQQFEVFGSAF